MVLPLRHSRAWLALGWLMVAGAIIVSLLPGEKLPPTGVSDKIEHAFAYMLLSVWFTGIYPRTRYPVIALALFAMGLLIEWCQGAMDLGRHSDLRDVLANSIGIAVGLTLSVLWLGAWAQRLEAWVRSRSAAT